MTEQTTIIIAFISVFALVLIYFDMKRKKQDGTTTGNAAIDLMSIILPIAMKKVDDIQKALEGDGEITIQEAKELVAQTVFETIQVSNIPEAQKNLFTIDMIKILTEPLLIQLYKTPTKKTEKKIEKEI